MHTTFPPYLPQNTGHYPVLQMRKLPPGKGKELPKVSHLTQCWHL